ncbi:MAG TPA: histidine kinase [Bacteroidia bacterium]|nr:histidine kinase [Bacteroidia bacterium]
MKNKSQLHLDGLKYQLSQHFIFNVMNTLRILIRKEPEQATTMLNTFSEYLRFALHKTTEFYSTLENELTGIDLFIRLQELRFKKQFHFVKTISPETLCKELPGFILQPFVEQLLKFSQPEKETDVTHLNFAAETIDNRLEVTLSCRAVYDKNNTSDRVNFSPKSDAEQGVETALELCSNIFGDTFTYDTKHEEDIQTITLTLPLK